MEPEHRHAPVPRRGRLRDEAGYSLVEIMVAIIILSIAIIPMVGMFDAGLRGSTESGNFDTARALANQKLEQAKSIPYETAVAAFPDGDTDAPPAGGAITSTPRQTDPAYAGYQYDVTKEFVKVDGSGNIVSSYDSADEADVGLLKVTVTVYWDDKEYSATGLVSV